LDAGAPSQPKGWETRKLLEEMGFDSEAIDDLVSTRAALVAQRV
jgi:hypothetical protein